MKKTFKIFSFSILFGVCLMFVFAAKPINEFPNTSENYQIKALKVPLKMTFAGENVPVNQPDIKERIDRELLVNTYWQSNGLLLIKRANKYFPIIEPILKKHHVPDDFKYLAMIESGLMNVTSPAGAKGIWQIMKNTAIEYGLEVNSTIDERYHLEKSTIAACEYLKASKEIFGSWAMAAAAYNAGNAGISRQIEIQKVDNYFDLLLNKETARYLPRMIALKEIMKNPRNYGFYFENEDLYESTPVRIIKVKENIDDLALFAQNQGINYKLLKRHNPWMLTNSLLVKEDQIYKLKIPKK